MRKLLVPAALVISMAAGSAAFAATAPKPAKPAASSTKTADCMKQWQAQKTHTQTRKAFLAACEKA